MSFLPKIDFLIKAAQQTTPPATPEPSDDQSSCFPRPVPPSAATPILKNPRRFRMPDPLILTPVGGDNTEPRFPDPVPATPAAGNPRRFHFPEPAQQAQAERAQIVELRVRAQGQKEAEKEKALQEARQASRILQSEKARYRTLRAAWASDSSQSRRIPTIPPLDLSRVALPALPDIIPAGPF